MTKAKPKGEESAVQNVDEKEELTTTACSLDEVERHLRAFIAAFVLPNDQARWTEFLIEKRPQWSTARPNPRSIRMHTKARTVLRNFAVDQRYCMRISNAQRTLSHYSTVTGAVKGVYFHLDIPPCQISSVEADTQFAQDNSSAILSFKAGRKALFFVHDYGVWLCERPDAP